VIASSLRCFGEVSSRNPLVSGIKKISRRSPHLSAPSRKAAKISARTHAPIPISVIGGAIGCVPNERFAKENERIDKESAKQEMRASVLSREPR